MNLSERILKAGENALNPNIIELKSESDIFVKNNEVETIITEAIDGDSNIILACSKEVEKYIACNYVREFIKKKSVELITNNIEDDIKYSTAQTIIAPEPSISDIVKILKIMVQGYKTFVYAINIKSFVKIFETLKLLIMLECPNLKEKNISHLLGLSSCVVLNVIRNEDGLFEIIDANKLYYEGEELIFEQLIKNETKREQDVISTDLEEADIDDELMPPENGEYIEVYNILDEEQEHKEDQETQENIDNIEKNKKPVNKYKLLREKIRKKKELT